MTTNIDEVTLFESPEDPTAVDIHMWVGEDNYTVRDYVLESRDQGMSKRIPLTSIPEGIVPGTSRLFVSHKKAILKVTAEGKDLYGLFVALCVAGAFTESQVNELHTDELQMSYWQDIDTNLAPGDFVPEQMLALVMALDAVDNKTKQALIKEFEIKFHPGVFGMGYISGIDYVCKQDEETLPEEIEHLEGYVTPVRVEYEDEE